MCCTTPSTPCSGLPERDGANGPPSGHRQVEIVSYRTVFDLERRVYRIDRLRLNPGGVPLRGIVYFLAIVAVLLLAAKLPLLGSLARTLPWYLRDLAIPAPTAALLSVIRIEGRSFHLAVRALIRYCLSARHLVGARACTTPGERWYPGELLVLPDGSDARFRWLRYTGAGAVRINAAHIRSEYGASWMRGLLGPPRMTIEALTDKPAPACGQVIVLAKGALFEVRGES